MSLFEALYGKGCRTPLCWQEIDEALTIGPKLIQATTTKDTSNPRKDEGSPFSLEELCGQAVKTLGVRGSRPSLLTSHPQRVLCSSRNWASSPRGISALTPTLSALGE